MKTATADDKLLLEDQLMQAELVIHAASMCSSLSSHCVSAIPRSITVHRDKSLYYVTLDLALN
jgi:hypothetical protein